MGVVIPTPGKETQKRRRFYLASAAPQGECPIHGLSLFEAEAENGSLAADSPRPRKAQALCSCSLRGNQISLGPCQVVSCVRTQVAQLVLAGLGRLISPSSLGVAFSPGTVFIFHCLYQRQKAQSVSCRDREGTGGGRG